MVLAREGLAKGVVIVACRMLFHPLVTDGVHVGVFAGLASMWQSSTTELMRVESQAMLIFFQESDATFKSQRLLEVRRCGRKNTE